MRSENFYHDVYEDTLKDAMLHLGRTFGAQAENRTNANSGVYSINDKWEMEKRGTWNRQYAPTSSYRGQTAQTDTNNRSAIVRSGRLIIDGKFCGMYDFAYINGNQSLDTDDYPRIHHWFTRNEDTHWALIYINGTLTTDYRIQIKPPVRKLGMCIYTDGTFTHNGLVSMTGRGANHSGTGSSGGYTAPVPIVVKSGLTIPSAGGTGGPRKSTSVTGYITAGGDAGSTPTNGSGGGGSGVLFPVIGITGTIACGAGSGGTCFTGGGGGGSIMHWSPSTGAATAGEQMDAIANGGAGGNGLTSGQTYGSAGGVGNPAGCIMGVDSAISNWAMYPVINPSSWHYYGYGETTTEEDKRASIGNSYYLSRPYSAKDTTFDGTAGTVIIMVDGTWTGNGTVRSEGGHCPNAHDGVSGCGSGTGGGGIAMVLSASASGGPTPRVVAGPQGNNYAGGAAGLGSAIRTTL